MISKAIDLSAWQPWLDAEKAKAAGIETVLCRAAYGYAQDKNFDSFIKAAAAAGLDTGAYQFATWHYNSVNGGSYTRAVQAANAQTDALLAILKGMPVTSYVALDMELEYGHASFLGKAQMTDLCNLVLDKIASAGYTPLLYASAGWFTGRLIPEKVKYKWWVAYYYNSPAAQNFDTVPAKFPDDKWGNWMQWNKDRIAIWQFTSAGYAGVYGVGGANLDKDWCYVPMNTVRPEPPAVPPLSSEPVTMAIGPASFGDRQTLAALAENLQLPYAENAGGLVLIGPASAGDQSTVLTKAAALGLPYAEYVPCQQEETLPEVPPVPEEITAELETLKAENEALRNELASAKADCASCRCRADEATKDAAQYLHRLQQITEIARG